MFDPDYDRITGIVRRRTYWLWQDHTWVQTHTIDLGRPDGVSATNAPLVREDPHPYAITTRRAQTLYDHLTQHGPARPRDISAATGMPAPTVVTVAARHPHLFHRRRRGLAVYYSVIPE